MSKQHKIRWTQQDLKDLNRVVNNFNAKVKRLQKKNPSQSNLLPDLVNKNQLKELINTRADLKREINTLKRFSKRGAEEIIELQEYGIKTTKWMNTEINRRIGIINRRRKARLEDIASTELTKGGESLGYTKAQIGMGKAELISLEPMTAFTKGISNPRIKERWKSIITQSQSDYFNKRDYLCRDNFIKTLELNFHHENVKDVIDAIKSMPIEDFMARFKASGNTFEDIYPTPENEKLYAEMLRDEYLGNNSSLMTSKTIINEDIAEKQII